MFKVHVHDGVSPLPEDDIYYIVAKEGIYLKKKMGVMESIAPVNNISILQSINKAARMNIRKIPATKFAQVVAFFREVYNKYYGEAIVLLFYNETKKTYKIIPPQQQVSGASCSYNKGITIEGMQMIGTIHSHAAMSAFHSGVDDNDEQHFDGLHITIGNLNNDEVSISTSIVANGHRFTVEPEEYINSLTRTQDIDKVEEKPYKRVFRWIDGKVVEDQQQTQKFTYQFKRYDKRFVVNVSKKYHKVPDGWMDMVERKTYTPVYHTNPYNFNPHLWRQYQLPNMINQQNRSFQNHSVLNVGPSQNIKPITFPTHDIEDIEDSEIPCTTCAFREYKFLAEQSDDEEIDVYKCKKCNEIIVDEGVPDFLICPKCKTDDFLILADKEDLPNNHQIELPTSIVKTDVKENSQFLTCETCNNTFHKYLNDTRCPFCYTSLSEKHEQDTFYCAEDELIEQSLKDQGSFLSSDTEEIQRAALEEVYREDNIINKIQDPTESAIPIPEKVQETFRKKDNSLFSMFKRVFGREGD